MKMIKITICLILVCRIFGWYIGGGEKVQYEIQQWLKDKKVVSVTQTTEHFGSGGGAPSRAVTYVTIIAETDNE